MDLTQILNISTPIVIALIGLIIARLQKKGILNADTARNLELDVGGAVASVSHEYISAIKKANEDGIVTPQEAENARKLAFVKIISIGKEKGIDYVTKYGTAAILGVIEKKVSEQK